VSGRREIPRPRSIVPRPARFRAARVASLTRAVWNGGGWRAPERRRFPRRSAKPWRNLHGPGRASAVGRLTRCNRASAVTKLGAAEGRRRGWRAPRMP
jgi:hypothetical protein